MANEKMKVGLSFNGKSVEVELTQEQLKELGLVEEKKKTGYEKVEKGRFYLWVAGVGTPHCDSDSRLSTDNERYYAANYYSDETIAENNARADKLMRQLRRFAAENGRIPSAEDWENPLVSKYTIEYDHAVNKLDYCLWFNKQMSGVVYFNSKKACEKAIEEFKDELTWYFTEYQAMLY